MPLPPSKDREELAGHDPRVCWHGELALPLQNYEK